MAGSGRGDSVAGSGRGDSVAGSGRGDSVAGSGRGDSVAGSGDITKREKRNKNGSQGGRKLHM